MRIATPWCPEVNAFALPEGIVYITSGIMARLDSEPAPGSWIKTVK